MGRFTRSDWRAMGGVVLLIIGRIGLIVVLINVLIYLLLGAEVLSLRAGVMALVCVALLLVASEVFSDRTIAIQTALQSVAIAGLLVGVAVIVTAAFRDWRLLGTLLVAKALLALGMGWGAAYALKLFQSGQKRHRKPPNNRMQRTRDA